MIFKYRIFLLLHSTKQTCELLCKYLQMTRQMDATKERANIVWAQSIKEKKYKDWIETALVKNLYKRSVF